MNYYNEIDPFAAAWLRNLIAAGHLPPGDVDSRSIRDVKPEEVACYTQRHWFCGIGGWPLALKLAGWPDDAPCDTGSAPCQPFSVAGKGRGTADERHLWPEFFRLIRECRPHRLFGEQVAGPAGLAWFDAVRADLEGEGYAIGMAVLGAHSVGAPHRRQRIYWGARLMADARCDERGSRRAGEPHGDGPVEPPGCGVARPVDDPAGAGLQGRGPRGAARSGREGGDAERAGTAGGVAHADGGEPHDGELQRGREHGFGAADGSATRSALRGSEQDGLAYRSEHGRRQGGEDTRREQDGAGPPREAWREPSDDGDAIDPWSDIEWLSCRDGKYRPTQRGLLPLAPRLPAGMGRVRSNRVGRLRGYGNAIAPPLAAAFVRAFLDSIGDLT